MANKKSTKSKAKSTKQKAKKVESVKAKKAESVEALSYDARKKAIHQKYKGIPKSPETLAKTRKAYRSELQSIN